MFFPMCLVVTHYLCVLICGECNKSPEFSWHVVMQDLKTLLFHIILCSSSCILFIILICNVLLTLVCFWEIIDLIYQVTKFRSLNLYQNVNPINIIPVASPWWIILKPPQLIYSVPTFTMNGNSYLMYCRVLFRADAGDSRCVEDLLVTFCCCLLDMVGLLSLWHIPNFHSQFYWWSLLYLLYINKQNGGRWT